MVADPLHLDVGLLEDLARDRFLQRLARLHEAGEGGVASLRPDRLTAQQRPVPVMHQHDHRRVGAWEMGAPQVGDVQFR